MPELPEVETVLRGLAPVLEGRTIVKAKVNRPDLRWPFPENMAGRINGQKIHRLWRRSKYILVDLSSGETLLVHLGMSGRILISGDPLGKFVHDHPAAQKHDHVVFDIDNGARVTFNDPRRFGAMDLLCTDRADHHHLLRHIGPEPLSNVFNETYLIERVKTKNSPIKSVLLDQKVVAGLGNIYVCEALYRAGISPERPAGKTSKKRLAALVPIIRQVLDEAIKAGGSSLRDFRQADGELGYFQHTFNVYGREGLPCLTDGCDHAVQRIVQSGRSSFYCKNCQK
ncbi:MAG: bifunctional DNA-formamidopyrimidine glycosylase/DNA-(apurinic or apyrimidinic site) lyase [Paracoccaceae bacterium]|jgi:formamidopyrimidine-DNA glycosylase|nr:bifunctional DNA-formamidopyrimidine glycosylase/DNA-(apurinic or apyrimidinic site) lyase [Paracoccaceae bacterium]|tara:strand:- start:1002 stop:1853 length:852 start_codon:yes stop_codon:yes gene_type:complete